MWCPRRSSGVLAGALGWVLGGAVSPAWAETLITPSIATVGTYLSNIGFSSNTLGGGSGGDYMISVAPSVTVQHNGQLMSGSFNAGIFATRFIENPEFSFVGISGGFTVTLDNLVKRVDPRLSLTVTDGVSYTPQQPAFLVPKGDETGPQGVDFRGIQAARANALTNFSSVQGGFAFTPSVRMGTSYSYALSRFGSPEVQPGVGGFLDTQTHSASVGPSFTLSPTDSVSVGYSYSKNSFDAGGPGVQTSNFETHGGYANWSHTFSPQLVGNLGANYSVISQGNQGVYGGNAGLSYRVLTTTTAMLNFSRQVMPSFYVAGLPLVSNTVTLGVGHTLSSKLSTTLSVGYSQGESEGASSAQGSTLGQGDLFFESYLAGLSLGYAVTQTVSASAGYHYSHFLQRFGGVDSRFEIHTVTLSLMGRWPYKWS